MKGYRPDWDDVKLGYVSKVVSTVSGLIAFGLLFIIKIVNETVNLSPVSVCLIQIWQSLKCQKICN